VIKKFNYLRRVFKAYLSGEDSQLTFWHGTPRVNFESVYDRIGQYYMPFTKKADYQAHLDDSGIPLLDYHGIVGLQYNPIAIAQYGLGNYNLFLQTRAADRLGRFQLAADWLVSNLEENTQGVWVWNHYFDWEYRETLLSPWYSALSQGQGISCLVRAHHEMGAESYLSAANKAFESFLVPIDQGGVTYQDLSGCIWLEEAIVTPPTHILNGFIWALWGIFDYYIYTADDRAKVLFDEGVKTLVTHLADYDTGYWSLYEISGTRMLMLASHFYHQLHIVQLDIMHRITEIGEFKNFRDRWESYYENWFYRSYSLIYKAVFKLLNY